MNPLLDLSGLPRFAQVRPEHVTPAVDALLAENRALVARLTEPGSPTGWREFAQPLEDPNQRLSRARGVVGNPDGVDGT